MTKKHFIELANALRAQRPNPKDYEASPYLDHMEQWEQDVAALADFCASQNPRFNRERWLAYIRGECGPNGGKL